VAEAEGDVDGVTLGLMEVVAAVPSVELGLGAFGGAAAARSSRKVPRSQKLGGTGGGGMEHERRGA
jgi:hypothetical protein